MNVNKANWESVYFCQTTQHTQLTTDSTACTHETAAHAWKAPKKIHPLVHPQKITWGEAIKMCKDMFLFLESLKLTNQQPMIKDLGLAWVWPFQKRRSTMRMYWLLLHQAPRHPGENTIAKVKHTHEGTMVKMQRIKGVGPSICIKASHCSGQQSARVLSIVVFRMKHNMAGIVAVYPWSI